MAVVFGILSSDRCLVDSSMEGDCMYQIPHHNFGGLTFMAAILFLFGLVILEIVKGEISSGMYHAILVILALPVVGCLIYELWIDSKS